MAEPCYHLEGVIHTRNDWEDFTGPLDLILALLSKNKIEIQDIRISDLLDQYLAYLETMKEMDLEIASEFIQMASYLTYVKTRMLLATGTENVEELTELVDVLEQQQNKERLAAVRDNLSFFDERSREGLRLHVKEPSPLPGRSFEGPIEPQELFKTVSSLLLQKDAEQEELPALRSIPRPIIYGIKEKSQQICRLLSERGSCSLESLYALCDSRSELVATFLSVLELCSSGQIRLFRQESGYVLNACP